MNILYDAQPGHFEVYALSELPGQPVRPAPAADAAKPVTQRSSIPLSSWLAAGAFSAIDDLAGAMGIKIPESFFMQNKPFQTVFDSGQGGSADLSFISKRARYVMLRWMPANPNGGRGFHIYEINMIGHVAHGYYELAHNPNAPPEAAPDVPGAGPEVGNGPNIPAPGPPGNLPFGVGTQPVQQNPPPSPPPVPPISP
jgi:hypothetical protein